MCVLEDGLVEKETEQGDRIGDLGWKRGENECYGGFSTRGVNRKC